MASLLSSDGCAPTPNPEQPPRARIYSDETYYEATSLDDVTRQRVARWQRERSEGTEDAATRAYRDRLQALAAKDWAAVPCDRCGAPGSGFLEVAGSALGVVNFIEQGFSLAVPGGRHRLLTLPAATPMGLTIRALVFCRPCHPGGIAVVEPGYEDAWEAWDAWVCGNAKPLSAPGDAE